jgi:hypothetical protein
MASVGALSEDGLPELTLCKVAKGTSGSSILITHCFPGPRGTAVVHERARVALLSYERVEPVIRTNIDALEPAERAVLARAVDERVPADEVDATVDVVRGRVSGMALSVVEHPEIWIPERRLARLDRFLASLTLPKRGRTESERSDRRAMAGPRVRFTARAGR